MHKSCLDCYEGPKSLESGFGILLLTIVAVLIQVMGVLSLLARILTLVLALIVVAILKVLIASVLTLMVFILKLGIVSGICLRGIIIFAPGVQTTVFPNVHSMDWALFLSTRMFTCWTGLFGWLLGLVNLLLGILSFLVLRFLDLPFFFFFLPLLELLLLEELLLDLPLSDDSLSLELELDSLSRSK